MPPINAPACLMTRYRRARPHAQLGMPQPGQWLDQNATRLRTRLSHNSLPSYMPTHQRRMRQPPH